MKDGYLYTAESRPWLQAALDTIAYSENIPIRLLDYDALDAVMPRNLYLLGSKSRLIINRPHESLLAEFCDGVLEAFNDKDSAEKISSRISVPEGMLNLSKEGNDSLEILRKIDRSVWMNWPSNHLQLQNLFRMSEEWIWFVNVWCYLNRRKLIDAAKGNSNGIDAFGLEGWKLYTFFVNTPGTGRVLAVCGPVYQGRQTEPSGSVTQDTDQGILQAFKIYQQYFAHQGISNNFANVDLSRVLNSRSVLSPEVATRRVLKVKKHIIDMEVLFEKWPESVRKSVGLVSNAAACTVASRRLVQSVNRDMTFHFQFRDTDMETTEASVLNLTIYRRKDGSLDPRSNFQSCKEHGDAHILQSVEDGVSEKVLRDYRSRVEGWSERVLERRRAIQSSRVTSFHDWLNFHANSFRGRQAATSARLYNFICQMMLEGIRADICHIYEYRTLDDSLKVLGRAYSDPADPIIVRISESVTEDMENIKTPLKCKSVVYRCIRSGEDQYLPNSTEHYSSDPEVRDAIKCVLVIPIKIHGRLLGLVELKSLTPYALQKANRFTVSHFNGIFAPFWYHQKLIQNFQKLNQLIMRPSLVPGDRVEIIGPHIFDDHALILADIFRSRGAAIWMRDKTEEGSYLLAGYSGPNLFTFSESQKASTNYINPSDSLSVCGELLRRYLGFSKTIPESQSEEMRGKLSYIRAKFDRSAQLSDYSGEVWILGQDYFEQQPLIEGIEDTVTSFRALLVVQENGGVDVIERCSGRSTRIEEPIAIITLYDSEDIAEPTWNELVKYVREELYFGLQVFYYQHEKYSQVKKIVRHELKGKCQELGDILQAIRNNTGYLQSRIRKLEATSMTAEQTEIFQDQLDSTAEIMKLIDKGIEHWLEEFSYVQIVEKDEIHSLVQALGTEEEPLLHEWIELRNAFHSLRQSRGVKKKGKGLFFDFDIAEGAQFLFDEVLFDHWWGNMLDNALKYAAPSSRVTVELISPKENRFEGAWILRMTNLGAPLPKGIQILDLFNMGIRANAERSARGDGVGLFLVKEICNLYDIDYSDTRVEKTSNLFSDRYVFVFKIPENLIRVPSRSVGSRL